MLGSQLKIVSIAVVRANLMSLNFYLKLKLIPNPILKQQILFKEKNFKKQYVFVYQLGIKNVNNSIKYYNHK